MLRRVESSSLSCRHAGSHLHLQEFRPHLIRYSREILTHRQEKRGEKFDFIANRWHFLPRENSQWWYFCITPSYYRTLNIPLYWRKTLLERSWNEKTMFEEIPGKTLLTSILYLTKVILDKKLKIHLREDA